jgi:hypothetical protein
MAQNEPKSEWTTMSPEGGNCTATWIILTQNFIVKILSYQQEEITKLPDMD